MHSIDSWPAILGLCFLLTLGYLVGVLRAIHKKTTGTWDDRWYWRLSRFYEWILKTGVKVNALLKRRKK